MEPHTREQVNSRLEEQVCVDRHWVRGRNNAVVYVALYAAQGLGDPNVASMKLINVQGGATAFGDSLDFHAYYIDGVFEGFHEPLNTLSTPSFFPIKIV